MRRDIWARAVGVLCVVCITPGSTAPPGTMMDLMQTNPPAPVITVPADCGGVSGELRTGLVRILGADGKSLAGAIIWSATPAARMKPDPAVPERYRVVPGVQAAGLVVGEKLDVSTLPAHLRLYAPAFLPYSGPNVYLWRDDGALVQVYHHKHIIQAVAVVGKVIIQGDRGAVQPVSVRWPTWAQAVSHVPAVEDDGHEHGHEHAAASLSSWLETRGAIGVLAAVGLLAGWGFGRYSGRLRR